MRSIRVSETQAPEQQPALDVVRQGLIRGGLLLFYVGRTHPIFALWRRNQTIRKSPAKPQNRRRQILGRRGLTCSRSGRRWRNCSIPRSIVGMPVSAPEPGCSRRLIIHGIAAPAVRPPRIARGPRRAGPAKMWRKGMLRSRAPPPVAHPHPTLPRKRERAPDGWPHTLTEKIFPRSRNLRPLSRLRGRARVGVLPPGKASTKPRRPITAPRPRFRHSIRSLQNSSVSPPRRKTPPRWHGRRATRWRRWASPPPRTRWKA